MAQDDLQSIKSHIARDAPATASAYIRRLNQVVPEIGREEIREILQGSYRLIYRVRDGRIDILTVYLGARLLDDSSL